jgi:hypothetical protein
MKNRYAYTSMEACAGSYQMTMPQSTWGTCRLDGRAIVDVLALKIISREALHLARSLAIIFSTEIMNNKRSKRSDANHFNRFQNDVARNRLKRDG